MMRRQQTLARTTSVEGRGLFSGRDVALRFCPAPDYHGVVFQRMDLVDRVRIPASIRYVVPRSRCTVLRRLGVTVEVVEHVLAALAGLRIDNCLVQLTAPEPPGVDGSALPFVEALLGAGIVSQTGPRAIVAVAPPLTVATPAGQGGGEIHATPADREEVCRIGFTLDYGDPRIPRQTFATDITPEVFVRDIAFARTFVLEEEAAALRAQGIGLKTTPRDLLVFGREGVIDNALRVADECVRHKVLDCIGDFSLIGCDLAGTFTAVRSGHRLNHELVRHLAVCVPRLDSDRQNSDRSDSGRDDTRPVHVDRDTLPFPRIEPADAGPPSARSA